jgi:hypothetical protein
MTNILCKTELMANQKTGKVLPAPENFECVQNSLQHPLFFFIDGDKNFNLCAQGSQQNTGWFKENLTADLSKLHHNKTVSAKTFDVTQNYTNGEITIALVVTIEGENNDYLYLLKDLSDTADAPWMNQSSHRHWLSLAYDGPQLPDDLDITNVYMKVSMESHIVCEVKNETTNALSSFKINSSGTPNWTKIAGAGDFSTLLGQKVGKPAAAGHAGLYQLTTNTSQHKALNFLPMNSADSAVSLTPPSGANQISTLVDDSGNTSLYVAASNAIYLFTPDTQTHQATGTKILDHQLIQGIQDFHCHQNTAYTLVWGLNQANEVFYSQCPKGKESDPKYWSVPLPLVTGVLRLSTYFSDSNDHSVIFVHKEGDELVQYTQDSETTFWHERSILLSGTAATDYIEMKTFTTHVQVNDNNNLPSPNQILSVKSSSPCNVYINSHFYFLSPELAIDVACDQDGAMTIIQETKDIGAVGYTISAKNSHDDPVIVNPMNKLVDAIEKVKTGDDLGAINVTNAQGVVSPLVGSDITSPTKQATAKALQGFVKLKASLPHTGSIQNSRSVVNSILDTPYVATNFCPQRDEVWAITFDGEHAEHLSQNEALEQFGMVLDETGLISFSQYEADGFWQFIKSTAGDIYQFAKHKAQQVKRFLVSQIDGVIQVFVRLGTALYRFVVNCLSDVLHAVEVLFKKIKVSFDKLVQWLGFIFQWQDIKRSHQVTKNIIKQYIKSVPDNISNYQRDLATTFSKTRTELKKWEKKETKPAWNRDFGGSEHSLGGIAKASTPTAGINEPQAHYGVYHMKNGLQHATIAANHYTPVITTRIEQMITTVGTNTDHQHAAISSAIDTMKKHILGKLDSLSFADLAKHLIAIIGDLAIAGVQTLVDTTLDLIKALITGVYEILDMTIEIPIVSNLYHTMTGNALSILDALCFVTSMAATVVYKVVKGVTPFADNETTNGIINATSWHEVKTAFATAGDFYDNPSNDTDTIQFAEIATVFFHFVASFGGLMMMHVAVTEQKNKTPVAPDIKFCAFFMSTMPVLIAGLINSTKQSSAAKMAEVLYGLTVLKNLFDVAKGKVYKAINGKFGLPAAEKFASIWAKANACLEMALGALSLVPPIWTAIDHNSKTKIANAVTASCWNVNRILGGEIALAGGPEKQPYVFGFRMLSLSGYVFMNTIFALFVDTMHMDELEHDDDWVRLEDHTDEVKLQLS